MSDTVNISQFPCRVANTTWEDPKTGWSDCEAESFHCRGNNTWQRSLVRLIAEHLVEGAESEALCLPQFLGWNFNSKDDRISRWGFGEMRKSQGWSPHNRISSLTQEPQRAHSAPQVRTEEEVGNLWPGRNPHKTLIVLVPWPWPSSVHVRSKFLLFKSPISLVFCDSSLNRLNQRDPKAWLTRQRSKDVNTLLTPVLDIPLFLKRGSQLGSRGPW